MGLGASFSVLIVAEMVGVKSGIGFYLHWPRAGRPILMYAALLLMALLCSGLISGLFMLRDRLPELAARRDAMVTETIARRGGIHQPSSSARLAGKQTVPVLENISPSCARG